MFDGKSCNRCDRQVEQMPSLKGKNFDETRIMFVLHKPDDRVDSVLWRRQKYEMALWTSKTGVQVFRLLQYCGLTPEDILLTNLFKCTLINNGKPRKQEYANCVKNLEMQVDVLEPKKIVAFGSAVYYGMFPGNGKVSDSIGNQFEYRGVPSLIMNHPSKWWSFLNPLMQEREYVKVRKFLE